MVTNASAKNPSNGATVTIQANEFPIKSVKLFSSGSAEITRIFSLTTILPSWQGSLQVVEIAHLPDLRSANVSVNSTSGVTILDHYHQPVADPFSSENSTPFSPTLRELEKEKQRLEDEKRVRQQSLALLSTYMDSLAQCKSIHQSEASQMVTFFDEFVEIGTSRSAVIAELDEQLADVDKMIGVEKDNLSKLGTDLPTKVVAVLSRSGQAVEAAELTLTYTVGKVSWKPEYDLYVSMTGNTPSPTVKLDFRCSVTQWTGESWENVSLSLTMANQVSQLIQLPEPKRIELSLDSTHAFQLPNSERQRQPPFPPKPLLGQKLAPHANRARYDYEMSTQEEVAAYERVVQATRRRSAASPPPFREETSEAPEAEEPTQTVSQLISHVDTKDPITHVANGSIFVPSDRAAHHVLVVSLSLHAEFMRVAVPSVDNRVYYTCEVKNNSEHVLFPGTVKTYLNDKHVSSTEIQSTDLPQTLECSLAVDTGIKIIHNRAPEVLPSAVATFTGKATTTYTSVTVLHNTHAESIRGAVVRCSIPLPADPRITIVLKEPAGLAEIADSDEIPEGAAGATQTRPSVAVSAGCVARWSTTGGRKGKQAGLFEWVCDVSPGTTEVLKAVWEICAPQNLKLLEQERSSE